LNSRALGEDNRYDVFIMSDGETKVWDHAAVEKAQIHENFTWIASFSAADGNIPKIDIDMIESLSLLHNDRLEPR
jgi:hypothetical protein